MLIGYEPTGKNDTSVVLYVDAHGRTAKQKEVAKIHRQGDSYHVTSASGKHLPTGVRDSVELHMRLLYEDLAYKRGYRAGVKAAKTLKRIA